MATQEQTIFQQGSTTYYWSSKFFPPEMREDVFKLYSFVRVADDYIDSMPQQADAFKRLRQLAEQRLPDLHASIITGPADSIDERVVKNICAVTRKYGFEQSWVMEFLDVMESDLHPRTYLTLEDSLQYVHGSAEVIGSMMAKIMGLPPEAQQAAMLQGRAMQWINFVRDIAEDNGLGRRYFPAEDLAQFNLPDLRAETARLNEQAFAEFVNFQINRYRKWQKAATTGYHFIPYRSRVPLKTAAAMYDWTANQIERDPLIVYVRKVKPPKSLVLVTVAKSAVL